MYKPIVSVFFLPLGLAGCATHQDLPAANFAADGGLTVQESAAASAEGGAVAAVDDSVSLNDMSRPTICEDIRRPGSRIVVERRCYTPDANPEYDAHRQHMVYQQIEMLRREQEEMERMAREREEASRRAAMEQAMRGSMQSR
jgi:hypothetical protein